MISAEKCKEIGCPFNTGEDFWPRRMKLCNRHFDKLLRSGAIRFGTKKHIQLEISRCGFCRMEFNHDAKRRRKYCSKKCAAAPRLNGRNRSAVPITKEFLEDCYWGKGMSLKAIAALARICLTSIHGWMVRLGVKRRPVGSNGSSPYFCIRCPRPALKHKGKNGKPWGNLCRFHWRLDAAARSRKFNRRKKQIPRERWKYMGAA